MMSEEMIEHVYVLELIATNKSHVWLFEIEHPLHLKWRFFMSILSVEHSRRGWSERKQTAMVH